MKKLMKFSWMLVLPAVVAAVVIWKSSAAVGQCPEVDGLDRTVLLSNPADCSSFFSCSLGVPILMHCPDGLHFNAELDVCDWPQNAGCPDREKTESSYPCHSSSVDSTETYTPCGTCEPGAKGTGKTGSEGTCKKTTVVRD